VDEPAGMQHFLGRYAVQKASSQLSRKIFMGITMLKALKNAKAIKVYPIESKFMGAGNHE